MLLHINCRPVTPTVGLLPFCPVLMERRIKTMSELKKNLIGGAIFLAAVLLIAAIAGGIQYFKHDLPRIREDERKKELQTRLHNYVESLAEEHEGNPPE